jgi:peptidoglycan/LPS O-acetylase OafA/YrhL
MSEPRPLPALTGLRFLAAFSIVIEHALEKVMPFPNAPAWYHSIQYLGAEGMSLFFVLSGFIIHYNYSSAIESERGRGVFNFFVARFARIYPLFLACLVFDLAHRYGYAQFPAEGLTVLPYYLAMVQTWLYWPVGQYGMIYMFGVLPSIAWSISTEWFFYMAYPAIWLGLRHLHGANLVAAAMVLVTVAYALVALAGAYAVEINRFGLETFGAVGEPAAQNQYSFFRWLVYFSPYSRIAEFLLGCLTAALFLNLRDREVSRREQRRGHAILLWTLAATALLHQAIFFGPPSLTVFHLCFGFAPSMAAIIFCCARYDNGIVRALSSWPLLIGGEASFSLYMLHPLLVDAFRWEAAPVTSFSVGIADLERLTITVLSAIGLSLVVWRLLEVPARRAVRRLFDLRSKPADLAMVEKRGSVRTLARDGSTRVGTHNQ